MAKSVIVLEFNELTPRLMHQFMAEGALPNFKRFFDESIVATTDAEEDPPALNPWVQWVTVHTGKSYAEHGVFHLADGVKYKGKRVWDHVSDAGRPVWVCGSMNSAIAGDTINGAVLPDPWAVGFKPYPPAFNDFFGVISRYVQEHAATKSPVSKADFARFVRFMLTNGLSLKTIRSAVEQLATERPNRMQWARAFVLDQLQRDIFKHHHRKLKPAFSTLFSNSTAHFQHFYWRNMEPEQFVVQPSETDQTRFADAIRLGYVRMDEALGEVMELADDETSIVFCTALSQQPLVKYDTDGGKQLFKPHDAKAFGDFAGIDAPFAYEPVMSDKFYLTFQDEAAATEAEQKVAALRLDDGRELMNVTLDGNKLVLTAAITQFPSDGALISSTLHNRTMAFTAMFYPIEGVKSGMHHRDGMLWIRTPAARHVAIERKVLLREIAPTLLTLCDTAVPVGEYEFAPIAEVMEQIGDERLLAA